MSHLLTTYVLVETRIGSASFPRCSADCFIDGELTITALDDGAEMRIFPAGTWRHATVYDAEGNVLFAIQAGADSSRPATVPAA